MIDKNIYIISLEFGVRHLDKGISYNQLIEHLKTMDISLQTQHEKYFHVWFYKTFYHHQISNSLRTSNSFYNDPDQLKPYDLEKAVLTHEGFQSYYDFVELREARESARSAQNTATRAIWISAILAGLAVLLQIIQILIDLPFGD
jgi:hypothetical protein